MIVATQHGITEVTLGPASTFASFFRAWTAVPAPRPVRPYSEADHRFIEALRRLWNRDITFLEMRGRMGW